MNTADGTTGARRRRPGDLHQFISQAERASEAPPLELLAIYRTLRPQCCS